MRDPAGEGAQARFAVLRARQHHQHDLGLPVDRDRHHRPEPRRGDGVHDRDPCHRPGRPPDRVRRRRRVRGRRRRSRVRARRHGRLLRGARAVAAQ